MNDPQPPSEPTPAGPDTPPAPASTPATGSAPANTVPAGDGAPIDPANESTIWTGRTHWQHYIGRVIIGAILVPLGWWLISRLAARYAWTGGTTLTIAAAFTAFMVLIIGGYILYRIVQNRYRLTGQRLFVETGILSQTIDQTELIRVDDVRVHKRLTDRLLNMGTVEVRSTDASDAAIIIRGVKNAEQVAELVRTNMRALRSRSLFIENL
jgi:membrane protein YdbS with pleckstrin-like domain